MGPNRPPSPYPFTNQGRTRNLLGGHALRETQRNNPHGDQAQREVEQRGNEDKDTSHYYRGAGFQTFSQHPFPPSWEIELDRTSDMSFKDVKSNPFVFDGNPSSPVINHFYLKLMFIVLEVFHHI